MAGIAATSALALFQLATAGASRATSEGVLAPASVCMAVAFIAQMGSSSLMRRFFEVHYVVSGGLKT